MTIDKLLKRKQAALAVFEKAARKLDAVIEAMKSERTTRLSAAKQLEDEAHILREQAAALINLEQTTQKQLAKIEAFLKD